MIKRHRIFVLRDLFPILNAKMGQMFLPIAPQIHISYIGRLLINSLGAERWREASVELSDALIHITWTLLEILMLACYSIPPRETWKTVPDMKSMSLTSCMAKIFLKRSAAIKRPRLWGIPESGFQMLVDIKLGSSVVEDLLSKYQKIFHKTAPKMLNSSWCLWFSCLCFCEPGRKWMEKGVLRLHCGLYLRVGIC